MTTRLTFSPGAHKYWLADPVTGRKRQVPSVTTLLGQEAKDNLVNWAAREAANAMNDHWDSLQAMAPSARHDLVANAHRRKRDTAAARGTQIHAWGEALIKGEPVDIPGEQVEIVSRFAQWWEKSRLSAVRTEYMVWSDEDDWEERCAYAGTCDLLASHPERGLLVLDHKTGATGPWPAWGIQVAAYAAAECSVVGGEDMPSQDVDAVGAIHIRPDGVDLHILTHDQRRVAEARWNLLRSLRAVGKPEFQQVMG